MLIDTHCHLDFPDFLPDFEAVLERAKEAKVGKIINVGASLEGSSRSLELAQKHPQIWATVGLHPHETQKILDYETAINSLREMAKNKKVVAIGECGLDYHQNKEEKQKQLLSLQLKLAEELNKPVVIHVREAQDDLLPLIKNFSLKGVFHCFSGNETFLKNVLDLGYFVGFDGNLTFKNAKDLQAVAKIAPLEKILLETDSPFLSPEPLRGTRNEPSRLPYLANFLANLRNEAVETVINQTSENAHRLFQI